jgi:hypothetical protein
MSISGRSIWTCEGLLTGRNRRAQFRLSVCGAGAGGECRRDRRRGALEKVMFKEMIFEEAFSKETISEDTIFGKAMVLGR